MNLCKLTYSSTVDKENQTPYPAVKEKDKQHRSDQRLSILWNKLSE